MTVASPPRRARTVVALAAAAAVVCLAVVIPAAAVPLLAVSLVVSFAASGRWLRGLRERDRMRTLYEAGRSLAAPLDHPGFGPFLRRVEQLLDARSAELVVVGGEGVTIHDRRGSVSVQAATPSGDVHRPQAYLPVRDGIPPQVAVIGAPGAARGALAVYRARDLSTQERSLFDDLAAQVGARLANQRLLGRVEEQRAELSDIISHSSGGIFVVSPAGVIESWNPAMERMTGSPATRAVGRTWADVFGSEGRAPGDRSPGDAREPAREPAGDILLVRPDGAERWIRYARSPLGDHDEAAQGEVVVARDITADLESERLQADFVGTVSHELRTPLTPLKGFLATLIAGTGEDDPAARQEYYRIMQHQTDRLERLITDLLEIARIEGGRLPLDDRSIDVTGVVQGQIADFTRYRPEREIRLRAPRAPVFATCDPFRVGQVVSNLMSNALKYSDPGAPVEVTVTPAGHGQVIVSVRDEGEGIPLAEQDRVFERFHRVEGHLTRRTGGTGLGLYIAKKLVEAMRGRIWVVSNPGDGSTFSFSLPRGCGAGRTER